VSKFYNPYNFIPLGKPLDGLLGQRKPVGHDRYHKELWSGRIEIEIETATPLLIPDASRAKPNDKDKEHKVFAVRKGPNGRPLLPSTSLKGALRSAYEAVTNSRLGVFKGHHTTTARRMAAADGLAMVPARVSEDGSHLELLLGSHAGLDWTHARPRWDGRWRLPGDTLHAAWLRQYRSGRGGYDQAQGVKLQGGKWPKHGQAVACWIELWEKGPFKYWKVLSLAPSHDGASLTRPAASREGFGGHRPVYEGGAQLLLVYGWVVKTNQNIGRKHDERVFFSVPGGAPHCVSLHPTWRDRYIALVQDYQKTHKRDLDERKKKEQRFDEYLGREPGKTAWSRHVCDPSEARLEPGDLVYARVDRSGKIEGLYPVMISRELGVVAPGSLLTDSLHPATNLDELSPADRVFGWVSQNQKGKGAYKGQLRMHSIECVTPDAIDTFDPPLPLAILGEPKEGQARFYVGKQDRTPLNQGADTGKIAYFERTAPERWSLRGRKMYPHQAATLSKGAKSAGYWDPDKARDEAWKTPEENGGHAERLAAGGANYREYLRRLGLRAGSHGNPPEQTVNQDSQNRSIREWVKTDVKFTAVIEVVNLNIVELGVLLWLLDLNGPRDANQQQEERLYHRLGGGKPLGFGSARISIRSVDLCTGAAKQVQYRGFFNAPDYTALAAPFAVTGDAESAHALREKAEEAFGTPFDQLPNALAFLVAARGRRDHPVHYPRTEERPNPAGENFKWFGENEAGRPGHPRRDGQRLALPALTDPAGRPADFSLPIDPTR
jgi:CRISPR-associated protein (TIGR03986 family)